MIKEYIHQPYPLFESKWKPILLISVFVALFMFIFQPFGLSNYSGESRSYFELGYGLITFCILIIDQFIIPLFLKPWFVSDEWTVLKQFCWQIWILFSIGLGNFLYTSMFLTFSNGFNAFLVFQFYTFVVGVIPILIITILHQNALLSSNLKLANELNYDLRASDELIGLDDKVCILGDNNKDKLEVSLSDFLYITSTGNYVQVYYLKNQQLKNVLLRNTLKNIEEQLLECHSIIKCHRAFLVNKEKILSVKGNSQGLRLVLKDTDEEVPVSRNYAKMLKDVIDS
jgi:hypothetical protein